MLVKPGRLMVKDVAFRRLSHLEQYLLTQNPKRKIQKNGDFRPPF